SLPLGFLDLRPRGLDLLGREPRRTTHWIFASTRTVPKVGAGSEHVRVSADHLAADRLDHAVETEVLLSLADRRMEDDLKQQIAELAAVLRGVVGVERLEHLVGLLDQVGSQRVEGLGAIPRAAFGTEQAIHQVAHAVEAVAQAVDAVIDDLVGIVSEREFVGHRRNFYQSESRHGAVNGAPTARLSRASAVLRFMIDSKR